MRDTKRARLLAYITGLVNQRLLLQCEYLAAENRILRSHVSGQLRLSDRERSTLAEIAKRLGGRQLAEVACIAKPARLVSSKRDGLDAERTEYQLNLRRILASYRRVRWYFQSGESFLHRQDCRAETSTGYRQVMAYSGFYIR
jgi:hypothetical protein